MTRNYNSLNDPGHARKIEYRIPTAPPREGNRIVMAVDSLNRNLQGYTGYPRLYCGYSLVIGPFAPGNRILKA